MSILQSKIALITGGTKGIGYGIAQSLLEQGVTVVITGRNEESTNKAAIELNSNGNDRSQAIGMTADVRDFNSMQQLSERIVKEIGEIDIVIANAGLGHFAPVNELSVEHWQQTIDTNLTGVFYTLKTTVESLIKTKGYFISISSLAGTNFFAGGTAYNASKFGVTGFTQAAMLDLRKHDVKVSTIMPGSVSTHFNDNEPDDSDAWKIQIEDIGKLVVDLLTMNSRTLPSKIEVRPTSPPSK